MSTLCLFIHNHLASWLPIPPPSSHPLHIQNDTTEQQEHPLTGRLSDYIYEYHTYLSLHSHPQGFNIRVFFFKSLLRSFSLPSSSTCSLSNLLYYPKNSYSKSTNSKQKQMEFLFKMGAIMSCCGPCAKPKCNNISAPVQYVLNVFPSPSPVRLYFLDVAPPIPWLPEPLKYNDD